MRTIGLSTNILDVVQLAGRISKTCKSYIDGVADYPKDLRVICVETESLAIVLQGLQWLDKDDAQDACTISQLEGPVKQCQETIKSLNGLLPPATLPTGRKGAKRRKVQSALDTLAWPLKSEKARKLLDELMQFKSTMSMAIGGSLLKDVQVIKKTLSASQVQGVCRWFEQTNPSPNHNAASALYENETLTWILRSDEWINWINLKTRCVWIYGIPGAGKTVLAAYLIDQVRRLCESAEDPKPDYVYYYCYHGHNHDEAAPFLRWLISQLCRRKQAVPEKAYKVHQLNQQPGLQELLDILEAVLATSFRVFIVIDAVDESQPRTNLLKVIEDLAQDQRFSKIQLLVTSRKELEIERTMSEISSPVSMSNPLVEEDIKKFVRSQIQRGQFQKWPSELKDEVEESLSNGAKGMFRWAVCQLDILRRLRHVEKIKASLRNLPEGLDESYERIFYLIDPEDRELVRHCLRWICFRDSQEARGWEPELTVSILLDSYSFSIAKGLHFFDGDTLRERCGCLLSYIDLDEDEGDALVSFAHYTVREFLESRRTKTITSLFFAIGAEESHRDVYNTIFLGALDPKHERKDHHGAIVSNSKFKEYCLTWATTALQHESNLVPYELAVALMDPSKPHYKGYAPLINDIEWTNYSGDSQIHILVNMLCGDFVFLAKRFRHTIDATKAQFTFEARDYKSPSMDAPSWNFKGNIFEFFASIPPYSLQDSNPSTQLHLLLDWYGNAVNVNYTRLLHLHIGQHLHPHHYGYQCLIERLLQSGAEPQPRSCEVTPLQIAVARNDVESIELLLHSHADPNGTGEADNYEWDEDENLSIFCSLVGSSPLYIVRRFNPIGVATLGSAKAAIERLLLDHGAREFKLERLDGRWVATSETRSGH
ncbi:hypothetical protein AK830_g3643 [Neonectria ditissima]|uniref:NACHT domain-containing protein n=1 Tax=Neonectria ditissima TaxID=78410 RepID=A0A0P7BR80_9HYPO|nr:hypothetical protein AK830_g3643 [Neonectria ditissima]